MEDCRGSSNFIFSQCMYARNLSCCIKTAIYKETKLEIKRQRDLADRRIMAVHEVERLLRLD